MAEREGFEPSKQLAPLGGLANRCTRPLCDLSTFISDRGWCHEGSHGAPRCPRSWSDRSRTIQLRAAVPRTVDGECSRQSRLPPVATPSRRHSLPSPGERRAGQCGLSPAAMGPDGAAVAESAVLEVVRELRAELGPAPVPASADTAARHSGPWPSRCRRSPLPGCSHRSGSRSCRRESAPCPARSRTPARAEGPLRSDRRGSRS